MVIIETITVIITTTPRPIGIELVAVQSQILDNAPAGTVIATVQVTMSDGSFFTGTLTSSDPFFAVSGMDIVTARQLTPADDGTHTTIITALQGGGGVAMSLSL